MAGESSSDVEETPAAASAAIAGANASQNPPSSGAGGSPCFDISEFLGTPRKDGSSGGSNNGSDEVFSNLSGLNLSPYMLAPSLPLCSKSESDSHLHDTDFSGLLLYRAGAHHNPHHGGGSGPGSGAASQGQGNQGGNHSGGGVGGSSAGRDFGFHDIEAPFTLFGSCSSMDPADSTGALVNNSIVSSPFPPGEALRSCSSFPPANMFGQHGSFLAGDHCCGGGLVVGEDLHGSSLAMGDVVVGGGGNHNNTFASSNACEWGVLCDGGAAHHVHHSTSSNTPPSLQQHSASLQCDSCQILRCIIHSNGA